MNNKNNTEDRIDIEYIVKYYTSMLKSILPFGAVLTAFGGVVLLIYFQQIRYIPPMGLTDFSLLFVASALLGLEIFIIVGLLPLTISFFWRVAFQIEGVRGIVDCDDWRDQLKMLSIWFSMPVCLIVLSVSTFFYWKIFSVTLAVLLIAAYLIAVIKVKGLTIVQGISLVAIVLLSAVMMLLVFSIWMKIAQEALAREVLYNQVLMLLLIMFILISVSTLTLKPYTEFKKDLPEGIRSGIWNVAVTAPGALVIFMAIGFSSFTNTVVRNLGVGGYKNVTIILNEEGKATLNALGIPCSSATEQNLCIVTDVKVLWGRGDEYFFNYATDIDGSGSNKGNKPIEAVNHNFTFPRDNVLSIMNESA